MASTYIQEHNRLFGDLTAALGRDLAHLSSEANGGRSILFVYPPVDEEKYIEEAKRRFTDGYEFIDLRQLFVEFVDSKGLDKFRRQFKNMGTEVFVSQNYTEGTFYRLPDEADSRFRCKRSLSNIDTYGCHLQDGVLQPEHYGRP